MRERVRLLCLAIAILLAAAGCAGKVVKETAGIDSVFGIGLYPGAELIELPTGGERQYLIQDAAPGRVQAWHEQHLKATGWDILQVEQDTKRPSVILKVRKADSHVWIRIEAYEAGTRVSLTRPARGAS